MPEPLLPALERIRSHLLDPELLVRAVASGRRRGEQPPWRRAEFRYVDLKGGRHLQVTTYDETQAHTTNYALGDAASGALDTLLDQPFGHWHVDTTTQTHQLRVTKKHQAVVHSRDRSEPLVADRGHNRDKSRLLPEDDPVFVALGLSSGGRIKPSRQAKFRQVEEFLRILDSSVTEAMENGHVRHPTAQDPLRVVDLGCGNAYLTFAAQRFLGHVRELPVVVTGADVKEQSRDHNSTVAANLGVQAEFVVGSIAQVDLAAPPDVVLALHACDTATDDALARAIGWQAPLVLAAPCCHHDVAAQLRRNPTPPPYGLLTRHGILRERLADTLTDGVRAALLRLQGYRVDVVEFIGTEHTPRNTLLRAVRTGASVHGGTARQEYDDLVAAWGIRPRLAELLDQ